MPTDQLHDDMLIYVCASCHQAACWNGDFYCENYKTAGLERLKVGELRKLNLEHPDHWTKQLNEKAGIR